MRLNYSLNTESTYTIYILDSPQHPNNLVNVKPVISNISSFVPNSCIDSKQLN